MKPIDHTLSNIARQHLGITTLKTRKSDRLDFHAVPVWAVKAALKSAFDAGAKTAAERPASSAAHDLPARFDDYEIQPCRRYIDMDEPLLSFVEPCEPFEADFWTLYGHIPGEGVQAIGDFDSRQHAEEVFAKITGQPYSLQAGHRRSRRP